MSTDRNRDWSNCAFWRRVACPSKLVNSFFQCISWFISPPTFIAEAVWTHAHWHALQSSKEFHQSSLWSSQPFSASEISLPTSAYSLQTSYFTSQMSDAGSLVLFTFASPAAPTSDWALGSAVAWLTCFLPHLLPNDCWTTTFPEFRTSSTLWLAARDAAAAAVCLVTSF